MVIGAVKTMSNKAHRAVSLKEIINLLSSATDAETELVRKAYNFAKKVHKGQKRLSGDPYFLHVATTGKYLAKIGMGPTTVSAGLLHDTMEDAEIAIDVLREEFNDDIAYLVEGVTKLGTVRYRGMQRHTESLRKLFAATSQDVRVMIIKLMDRLHNARTLEYVPKEKRQRIALETIEIYAPIADRLGMGVIKRELENAAFPFAYPDDYDKVNSLFMETGGAENEALLKKVTNTIRKLLSSYGLENFRTETRKKGLYSLFRKLQRRQWDISKIYDIWALRIIVPTVADCYTVLGILHSEGTPVPGKLKDYIAAPKPNGYQSIHTTVLSGTGLVFEIQIRTEEMHEEAQFGIASHFSYKEAGRKDSGEEVGAGLSWIKQFIPSRIAYGKDKMSQEAHKKKTKYTNGSIPEWISHVAEAHEESGNPSEFLEEIKSDFFNHRVFVFTPQGDVIDLPTESTAIDFAYAIHSDIGDHVSGAKVCGKMVSLDTPLQNGDIVEILTSDSAKPNRKWLDMVQTTMAKRHIRGYLQGAQTNT